MPPILSMDLPSLNGLVILFSARTGLVEPLLLDNGYLTDVRTAAAAAVATRHLVPAIVTTAGVLGGGAPPELGADIAGHVPGRRPKADIIICDLAGTGAQDTTIAAFALQAARTAGAGNNIQT